MRKQVTGSALDLAQSESGNLTPKLFATKKLRGAEKERRFYERIWE